MSRMVLRAPAERPVHETFLPLPGRRRGKVRDVYQLPPDSIGPRLLIVASDRISAFDVVMPTPIPEKGRLLTKISSGWFDWFHPQGIVESHLIDLEPPPDFERAPPSVRHMLTGRVMVCRAAKVVPIECIVRGYLAGSGWAEYRRSGSICGQALPAGLRQCEALPTPIFTPSTKVDDGHDQNISFDEACRLVGGKLMEQLRSVSLALYTAAARYARERGVILADTKFEFGHRLDSSGEPTDDLLLVDEVLTPDSSRYWPAEGYAPGADQPSFDKQFLRNWLEEMVERGAWDKTPPGPQLPPDIVRATRERYEEAAQRLFG